jgi:DNA-binding IclR family transcriptional regulator
MLRAFTPAEPHLSLGELAACLDLAKATTHRIAAGLVAEGLMAQRGDGRYELGSELMQMGELVRRNLDVVGICAPAMSAVARSTDETVVLCAVDWAALELTIVDRRDSAHPLSVLSPVGHRSGIYPSCLGRAALSGLDPADVEPTLADWSCPQLTAATRTSRDDVLGSIEHARRLGYAIDPGEFLEGTAGVAVPVVFDGGRPRAALGIVGPSGRLPEERLRALGETLRELTAQRPRAGEGMT